ncbi:MAG: TerB N-terminal domain-containing protein [Clostridia bacterium]|nr:TerB N-terminal domain-containing protein [Clostridia bacterium]
MNDRTDNKNKEPNPLKQQDDFWDLDKMLPQSVQGRVFTEHNTAVRDTDAVEISAGDDDGAADEVRIPPIPNITSRMQRAASYRSENRASRGRDPMGSRHTPGDVSPQMAQPVCSYEPENSFIRRVSVFRWPERFNYYERFTADAERYYNRTAQECPFVNFFAYMPQYGGMSQDQLRWYLYWRDNVRHGVYLSTDYSYIFLYVYEIINLPDKISPAEGLEKLCDVWLAYREQFPRLDRYLGEWVCDYCLVYQLPAPLERLRDILPSLVAMLTFREFYLEFNADGDCPITAQLCDILTGAAWKQSKYLTPENRPLFEEHLYAAVLGVLRHAWAVDPDFVSLLGFNEVVQSRNAFSGALCTYACKRRIDVSYLSLSRSYQLKFIIADLFKLAENCIRAHLGIKARLNAAGVPELLKNDVKAYFEEHLPPYRKPEKAAAASRAAKAAAEQKKEESAYAALYEPLSRELSTENALALEMDSWANTGLLVPEDDGGTEETVTSGDVVVSEDTGVSEDTSAAPKTPDIPEALSVAPTLDTDTVPDTDDITYDDPYENFVRHLSDAYYTALKHIICREEAEFSALCASLTMLPDAVADAINELAVTYTDDTVLDADGNFWILSDFYANDVMNAVVAREEDA